MKTVITFGTFDLIHVGHVNIIERASKYGDKLVVGISTDKLNYNKKQRYPIYNQYDRQKIVESFKWVTKTFFEHSLEEKRQYILEHKADVLVMGNDWEGRFDEFKDICEVVYLPRTENISTTQTIDEIKTIFVDNLKAKK
jgi:glycerol-3-phosphate cytidylyltransferase